MDGVGYGLDSFFLIDDNFVESFFYVQKFFLFGGFEVGDGNIGLVGDDFVDLVWFDDICDYGIIRVIVVGIQGSVSGSFFFFKVLDDSFLFGDGVVLKIGSMVVVFYFVGIFGFDMKSF